MMYNRSIALIPAKNHSLKARRRIPGARSRGRG